MRATDHELDLDSGRIFAREWTPADPAEDAPLLLFHDSLGCVELWRGFPAALARSMGRRVIAYDRLGFGRSQRREGRLPLDFIPGEAEALPGLLAALGAVRFVAFGHSVGGAMAAAAAARHPRACEAVITEAAQSFVEDRTLQGIRDAKARFEKAGGTGRLERYHGDKARWVLDAWTETWLDPAFAGWSLEDELARVRCPLLALHGDADEFGSPEHPRRIAASCAGPAETRLLPGCGHVPHRERPEEVLALVGAFLERLPRGAA